MVKNRVGGSRHKKQARKNIRSVTNTRKIRLAKEEGEIYAKVIKMFGNGMADVLCNDKVVRLLIIRKKFKGRNKRDNNIVVDAVLLVGRRLWEVVSAKKKQKEDLLCVYSKDQLSDLRKKANILSTILPTLEKEGDCGVDFDDSTPRPACPDTNEKETTRIEEASSKTSETTLDFGDVDFDEI